MKKFIRCLSNYLIIILLIISLPEKIYSQTKPKDAEFWENITLTKQLSRKNVFHFNQEGRVTNNFSQFRYTYGDFGVTHRFTKHFKAELDYVLVWKQTDTRQSWRHQFYGALFYKFNLNKRIELLLRTMYQQQYQDIYSSELGRYPENYLRNKITVSYQFKDFPYYKFEPYVAIENYYHMDYNNKYGPEFDRNRYFAGCFYSFNKQQAVELYYLIEHNFNTNDAPINYVLGVGYEYDF